MPLAQNNLNSLARGKVRTSWAPRNLYNLYKKRNHLQTERTLFQQKWSSKRELRAYHGEHIQEKIMVRQLPQNLQGVVLPLGDDVISEEIMGKGQLHRDRTGMVQKDDEGNYKIRTPFAIQTFAHLERRLDFAVFRSMFASSVRQAGQFVRQGNVMVNGVKVKHSSYPLKSGDLISVKPEKVLYAAGKAKPSVEQAVTVDNRQIKKYNVYLKKCNAEPEKMWNLRMQKIKKRSEKSLADPKKQEELQQANEVAYQAMLGKLRELCSAGILEDLVNGRAEFLSTQSDDTKALGEMLLKLIDQHFPEAGEAADKTSEGFLTPEAVIEFLNERSQKLITEENANEAEAGTKEKRKAEATATNHQYQINNRNKILANIDTNAAQFSVHPKDVNYVSTVENPYVRNIVSNVLTFRKSEYESVDDRKVALAARSIVQEMLTNVSNTIHNSYWENQQKLLKVQDGSVEVNPLWLQHMGPLREKIDAAAAAEDEKANRPLFPWQGHLYGRQDPSKKYFTPWRFRPFISPSVIYPHHIEVDFTTCSAVYMRDPVARPGMSEVISPFSLTKHEFANLYYNKR